MKRIFFPKTLCCIGLMVCSPGLQGMGTLVSLGSSVLQSEFVKKHIRDMGVIVGGAVLVVAYKTFFARLDRIEALTEEIERKINATYAGVGRLDDTFKMEIQTVLDKIILLPNKYDQEKMLLELRKILIDDLRNANNETTQKLFEFETRIYERLSSLEKTIEEKLARLEQKIDRYTQTVKVYQADVDKGLDKLALGQKEIIDATQTLKQAAQQQG